jgi:hypothetical protein
VLETFALGCLLTALGALGVCGWVLVRIAVALPSNIRATGELDERALLFNDSMNQRVAARANRDEKVVRDTLESMGIVQPQKPLPEAPVDPGIKMSGRVDDPHELFREMQRKKRDDAEFDARDRVSTEI